MRLMKMLSKKDQPTVNELKRIHSGAANTLITNLSTREANARIACHEARLNLAIGLSPILAQLRREWGNENDIR